MIVTSLGLSAANVANLNKMSLGGRLNAWQAIGVSDLVYNVLATGYKIPLRFVPSQYRTNDNLTVSEDAHNVLLVVAEGLSAKIAITPNEHKAGEFVSPYWAVTKPGSPGKYRPTKNVS